MKTEPVLKWWRSRSLLYMMIGSFLGIYQPCYETNRDALRYALDVHGVNLSADECEEILTNYHEFDVFQNVRDGIEHFHEASYEVHVVSNGNLEMFASMVA